MTRRGCLGRLRRPTSRAYAAAMTARGGGAQLATSSEPTPPKCRLRARGGRQVELAAADVRAAVDDAHADHAVAPAQGHARAARQRLVRDAERARRQAPAARQLVAVQAGAVPRHRGAAVDVEPPDLALRGVDEHAQPGAAGLAAGGRRSRSRRRRAWWRGRWSSSRCPERRCSSAGRPAAPETHAAAARTPGVRRGRSAGSCRGRCRPRSAAWAAGGVVETAPCPAARTSEMAKQSAPSAVTAPTGAQVQMRPHARSIPPCGQPPAGQGMSAANDGRRYGAVGRRPSPAGLRTSETTRRSEQKFVTVARPAPSSVTRVTQRRPAAPPPGVPARTIASSVAGMIAKGTSGCAAALSWPMASRAST